MLQNFSDRYYTFPDVSKANSDGLIAIGGDLSPECLLSAFHQGIFPWFTEDDPILWWSPDPRFVVFPEKAKISKSLKKSSIKFETEINKDFESVISKCAEIARNDQNGTWITKEMQQAYIELHKQGYAYSFEVRHNSQLAGGLYGVLCGKMFIGESMFSLISDASKTAYKNLIEYCMKNEIKIIDCQFHTSHLESLGGEYIPRKEYLKLVQNYFSL